MITKQEFMEEYSSYSKKELIELLYFEMDMTESLDKHINFLHQEYEELETEIEKRQKAREERIEYLKYKLIPELEERREKAATKRILAAWGIISVVILWIFYSVGAITNLPTLGSIIIVSLFCGGLCLYAFALLFLATLNKNVQERHNIDKYEHEISLFEIYRNIYFT